MNKRTRATLRSVLLLVLAFALTITPLVTANATVIGGTIHVSDEQVDTGYAPDLVEDNSSGNYQLEDPVDSGGRSAYDAALNSGGGGSVLVSDAFTIDKAISFDEVSGDGTLTLTIDVSKPLPFSYYPAPQMDYIFVMDITTSMLQPYRGVTTQSNWQSFWDDRCRRYQMSQAVKEAASMIWTANPESTITIVPFAGSALKPNRTGNGFSNYVDASSPFTPSGSSFDNTDPTSDPDITSHIHTPASGALSDPTNYSDKVNNIALTQRYKYFKVTKADAGIDLATFGESIDVLALESSTNTNAGMTEALDILKNGGLEATEKARRVVMLITDGGANVAPGNTPEQYYNNAAELVNSTCSSIKGSAADQGNAMLSVVSIFPSPIVFATDQSILDNNSLYAAYTSFDRSGTIEWTQATENIDPFERYTQPTVAGNTLDVQNGTYGMCTAWATNPSRYYGADQSIQAVRDAIQDAVDDANSLFAGYQSVFTDTLNTLEFEKDANAPLDVKVSIDGASAISPGDPGFPTSFSVSQTAEGITVDLGTVPYGDILSASSRSVITISYPIKLRDDIGAHYLDLHSNIDDMTYLSVTMPRHKEAYSNNVVYTDPSFSMPFPTPTVVLDADKNGPLLTLVKVDESGDQLEGSTFTLEAGGKNKTTVSPLAGKTDQFALSADTDYVITETITPTNYNGLTSPVTVAFDSIADTWALSEENDLLALEIDPTNHRLATLTITNEPKSSPDPNPGPDPDPNPDPQPVPRPLDPKIPGTGDTGLMVIMVATACAAGSILILYKRFLRKKQSK